MAEVVVSTCAPWATADDVCPPCDDYDFPNMLLDDMLQVASDLLYQLSGRQFPGICDAVIHPCTQRHWVDAPANRSVDFQLDTIYRGCGCSSPRNCGCTRVSEISLGVSPITEIDSVTIDGVELDDTAYRVDDYAWLVRTDGDPWPCCTDANDPDSFSIAFSYGIAPPPAGVHAAAVLACELAQSCHPIEGAECQLPKRLQSVTRQGVTMILADPSQLLTDGRVGITEIDMFLAAYNPRRIQARASAHNPDLMGAVRRIGT